MGYKKVFFFHLTSIRVEHQVRYLNLKENIKIRRAGFCYRNFFEKFLKRFAILTLQTWPQWTGPTHQGIKLIMDSVNMDPQEWQLGKTKVFIKSPESLFRLEEQRDRKFHGFAKVIQKTYRRYKSRKVFLKLKEQAVDIVYNKKQRKRFSLNREFAGDYISYSDNPVLKALVGKNVRVYFADMCQKYDRKFQKVERELVVTEHSVIIFGSEKAKDGPNKGKYIKMIKRTLKFGDISSISVRYQSIISHVSTKCDDLFVIHIPSEYDNVLESLFKTELLSVLR